MGFVGARSCQQTKLGPGKVFVDLGSGVGNCVVQAALAYVFFRSQSRSETTTLTLETGPDAKPGGSRTWSTHRRSRGSSSSKPLLGSGCGDSKAVRCTSFKPIFVPATKWRQSCLARTSCSSTTKCAFPLPILSLAQQS